MRRKIRTIFTLLSIFVAFVLFGYLMAIRAAFSMGVDLAGADRLMVLEQDLADHADARRATSEQVQAIEGVKDVTHANWFGGYYQETKNQFAEHGGRPRELAAHVSRSSTCRRTRRRRGSPIAQGAIVGVDTAKRFGWKVGDRVPLQATIFRRPDGGAGSSTSPASTIRRSRAPTRRSCSSTTTT